MGLETLFDDNTLSLESDKCFSFSAFSPSTWVLNPPDLMMPEGLLRFLWESYTFGWITFSFLTFVIGSLFTWELGGTGGLLGKGGFMIYDFFTWWASLELLLFLFGIAGVYLFCSFRLGLFTRGIFFYWAPFNYCTFSAIFWIFYSLLIGGSAKILFCLITFFCFSSWSIIFSKLAINSFLFYLTPPCYLLDSTFFYPWFMGFGKITTGSLFTSGFLITYSFLGISSFFISFLIFSILGSLSRALTTFFEST